MKADYIVSVREIKFGFGKTTAGLRRRGWRWRGGGGGGEVVREQMYKRPSEQCWQRKRRTRRNQTAVTAGSQEALKWKPVGGPRQETMALEFTFKKKIKTAWRGGWRRHTQIQPRSLHYEPVEELEEGPYRGSNAF